MGRSISILTVIVISAAGCHLVFPFEMTEVAPDSSPAADTVGPSGEQTPGDSDTSPPSLADGGLQVDQGSIALPFPSCVDANGCVECQPLQNKNCVKACAQECDDLPALRDPWPVDCNKVLLDDDFKQLPCANWTPPYGGKYVNCPYCGVLRLFHPEGWTIGATLKSEYFPTLMGTHLVEVRLAPAPGMHFSLASNWIDSASPHRTCLLKPAGAAGYFTLRSIVRTSAKYQSDEFPTGFAIPNAADGAVLQSWISGSVHYCRLVAAGLSPPIVLVSTPVPEILQGGSIQIEVTMTHDPVDVDYVRVFSPP
jgi:hypothetical protein